MTEYRVSDKLRYYLDKERTVAIQTGVAGQLKHAMKALQGIEVSIEKGFVGNEDADYISVVVYGNHFFTPYETGYRDLSADDYMTFDEAFDKVIPESNEPKEHTQEVTYSPISIGGIPESNEPKEQDTPNDKLFESKGPLGVAPKPEPGVKYLWESRKKNQEGGGKVVLFMHKEEGVMGMGISGLRWYESLEQAQRDADTHLTVEELEEQGYNLEGFFFYPLKKEPERFIWVTSDESGILYRNGKGLIDIETLITMKQGYQHEKSHLTEADVEDSMYDTRKFTKKPITRPIKEQAGEPKVTYKFTARFNKLRGKESFTVTVDNQEQADTLTDLLGGLAKVGVQYSDRSVELFLYKSTYFRPDFLNFVSDEVPNLSFEEAVEKAV